MRSDALKQVEPGLGDEAVKEAGPVLHPPEPGLHQCGQLIDVLLGEVRQRPFQIRPDARTCLLSGRCEPAYLFAGLNAANRGGDRQLSRAVRIEAALNPAEYERSNLACAARVLARRSSASARARPYGGGRHRDGGRPAQSARAVGSGMQFGRVMMSRPRRAWRPIRGAGYRRAELGVLGEVGGVLVRGRLVVGPPGGVLQAQDAGAAERSGGQGGAPYLMLLDFDRW
jgi:hypothetical protein